MRVHINLRDPSSSKAVQSTALQISPSAPNMECGALDKHPLAHQPKHLSSRACRGISIPPTASAATATRDQPITIMIMITMVSLIRHTCPRVNFVIRRHPKRCQARALQIPPRSRQYGVRRYAALWTSPRCLTNHRRARKPPPRDTAHWACQRAHARLWSCCWVIIVG